MVRIRGFQQVFACLVKWVESVLKTLLVVYDGRTSHVSLKTVETARENSGIILGLLAYCSHLLQILDVRGIQANHFHFSFFLLYSLYTVTPSARATFQGAVTIS